MEGARGEREGRVEGEVIGWKGGQKGMGMI